VNIYIHACFRCDIIGCNVFYPIQNKVNWHRKTAGYTGLIVFILNTVINTVTYNMKKIVSCKKWEWNEYFDGSLKFLCFVWKKVD